MDAFQWLCSYATSSIIALYGLRLPPNGRKLASVCFVLSSLHNIYLTSQLDMYSHAKGIACFTVLFFLYHISSIFWFGNVAACETWLSAYKMLYNVRWVGTSRSPIQNGCYKGTRCYRKASGVTNQAKIPAPHKCQSRMGFVCSQIFALLRLYAFMVFYNEFIDLEGRLDVTTTDFSPEKASFWRRYLMSSHNGMDVNRELMVRIHISFDWIIQMATGMVGLHEVLAIIFVLLGLDEPDEWPPLFGPLSDIVSLRAFYADFWHHLHYRSYVSYSRQILKLLGIRGMNNVTKLCLAFIVFTISGFNHWISEFPNSQAYLLLRKHLTYWWIQVVVIIIEDYVQLAYQKLFGQTETKPPISKQRRQIVRVFGRVWVVFIFSSVLPKVYYDIEPVSS